MSVPWNEAAGVVILIALAVAVLSYAGVAQRRAVVTASVRAVVQLALVALALRGVFAAPVATVAVLGVMFTVATLTAARRMREHPGALRSREACRPIAREAVSEALVPALDQTRTVGLVILPGAFAGALIGGASVAAAAQFQIVVLVGLLCAEAITAVVLAYRLGAPACLPAPDPGDVGR